MIQARIHLGKIQVEEPIPQEWEGQRVKILPLTPDDPLPDLDERLAALDSLGPMEFEPAERERIAELLGEMDRLGREELEKLGGGTP